MAEISFDDFLKVDVRVGEVIRAEDYPEARKPAIKMWVDFGDEIGERKTSAQITDHYTLEQISALNNLMLRIQGRTGKLKWTGHNQHAAKACPGFNVPKWLAERDNKIMAPEIPAEAPTSGI